MPKKYTEADSNSTFDFAEWGDRGRLQYAPETTEAPQPTQKPVDASEWEDLPILMRRSFGAFLTLQAESAANTVAFRRQDPIRMDGADALIPYVDQRSGAHFIARCAPDGAVRLER